MNTEHEGSSDKNVLVGNTRTANHPVESAPDESSAKPPKMKGGGNLDARSVPSEDSEEQEKTKDSGSSD
jgi:hypothetical protein